MDLGSLANGLAKFQGGQFPNNVIPENEANDKRGNGRCHGSKCDIEENVEAAELIAQPMEIVHHERAPSAGTCLENSSITRSVGARRLPLINTRSHGSAISVRSRAASVVDPTVALFSKPAFS